VGRAAGGLSLPPQIDMCWAYLSYGLTLTYWGKRGQADRGAARRPRRGRLMAAGRACIRCVDISTYSR